MSAGRWGVAVAASGLAHGALFAGLALAIAPAPLPAPEDGAAAFDLVSYPVPQSQPVPETPVGTPAPEATAEGTRTGGGAIPQSRATPTPLRSDAASVLRPEAERVRDRDPAGAPLRESRAAETALRANQTEAARPAPLTPEGESLRSQSAADGTALTTLAAPFEKLGAVAPEGPSVAPRLPQAAVVRVLPPQGDRVATPSTEAATRIAPEVPPDAPAMAPTVPRGAVVRDVVPPGDALPAATVDAAVRLASARPPDAPAMAPTVPRGAVVRDVVPSGDVLPAATVDAGMPLIPEAPVGPPVMALADRGAAALPLTAAPTESLTAGYMDAKSATAMPPVGDAAVVVLPDASAVAVAVAAPTSDPVRPVPTPGLVPAEPVAMRPDARLAAADPMGITPDALIPASFALGAAPQPASVAIPAPPDAIDLAAQRAHAAPIDAAAVAGDDLGEISGATSEDLAALTLPADRQSAALAWSGEAGAVVDPLSLAAIQSFTVPGDPDPEAGPPVRDRIGALLATVPCARLQTEFNPDNGALTLRGHIPEDDLRAPVLTALAAQVGGSIPVRDSVLILPRPVCGALAGIAAVGLAQSDDQEGDPRVVGAAPHTAVRRFAEGDRLTFALLGPDYPAFYYIDYFDAAGNVIHLQPNETVPLRAIDAEGRAVVGSDADGAPALELYAAPPFGQEILAAFAASAPLYDGGRPLIEPAAPYLEFLRERVAQTRRTTPDFKGEWFYIFVQTGP